jgi:hypothetical protein
VSSLRRLAISAVAVGLAACSSGGTPIAFDSTPSTQPTTGSNGPDAGSEPSTPQTLPANVPSGHVALDVAAAGAEISPLILGVSPVELTSADFKAAGLTLNSWGGNPATRYNYRIGHAWNNGADWEFRNTNYGITGDAARTFLGVSQEAGVASRMVVPTLGWVANNDDTSTCSFPTDGGCQPASEVGNCRTPKARADPARANVESTPEDVATWVRGLLADGYSIQYVAMDNEPELWGDTHFDVHPECPTYEEILDKYLTYAAAIRAVAPDAKLTGPVMCCWYDYWKIAPGPAGGGTPDFLRWFLEQVKAHDDQTGQRSLDVVDVHFYPQTDVYNDKVDADTSARRLRSTRALWDPTYIDESWIHEAINFIPRIKQTIAAAYPGTPLMISEWNFGAEETMNGALAIAEVLGVYGREGVEAAAYWRDPKVGSPGFLAFAMHGNYDGAGTRFGGRVVPILTADGSGVVAFAAHDANDGTLRIMLVNERDAAATLTVDILNFRPAASGRSFTLAPDKPDAIVPGTFDPTAPVTLPPSSITVLDVGPAS